MDRIRNITRRFLFLAATAGAVLPAAFLFPQTKNETPAAPGEEIIPFLNQTLVWYRQLAAQEHLVSEPSDVLFVNDNRQVADQVVRLSFEFARARAAELAGSESAVAPSAAPGASQYQRISDVAAKADQQVKQTQQELDGLRQRLLKATGKQRRTLQATIAETESELGLFQARRDIMRNLLQMAAESEGRPGAGSLPAQIEELARTVPAVAGASKEAGAASGPSSSRAAVSPATAPPAAIAHKTAPSGILPLISDLFELRRKTSALDDQLGATDALVQSSKAVRAPLVAQMRALTKKGDQLAAQAGSTDPAVLAQERKDLDALTAQYKQISASLLPLGRQTILLGVYKRNLADWRDTVSGQFGAELKDLLLRLGGLGVVLGVVLGVSEVWRRATLRYITDVRRRNQFLLLRRIALWCLVAIILAFAFSNQLGALTTFAGLLTAGVAVALQSVILSVVGYFFLIGKYGVRVGDRVQVAGTVGDVVDIGLVRLHLMEVTGGPSPQPTGRVVAFSNSVVFQATAGLFKPIPGTNFLWHEITIMLGPETNYRQVEQRMLDAVNKVYSDYRDRMEIQRRSMERSLRAIPSGALAPESRVRLTATGLEVAIRYPVELGNAAAIDDRVTRELLDAIGREPKLRLLGAQIEAKSA